MKITYYTHKPEQSKTKELKIGSHVVGLRLLALEINSNKELEELLTEDGVKWAKRNLRFGRTPQDQNPVESNLTDNRRESNWGSDWVDDGV